MTFNIGDRVRYFGPYAQGGKDDFGTIVSRDSKRAGAWCVDCDNGERLHVQDQHIELINCDNGERLHVQDQHIELINTESEISASISLNKLSVKQLKDFLNKMDDSIQLSFTDLKIHFG